MDHPDEVAIRACAQGLAITREVALANGWPDPAPEQRQLMLRFARQLAWLRWAWSRRN